MISKIFSATVNWLETSIIDIEIDINNWLPAFTIVWLPDQWVQESKERIRSAMKSSWYKLPLNRITVNLAPADIKKIGSSYDFPIAIWILVHEWLISKTYLKDSIFIWELWLDWNLRWVNSILPIVIKAQELWFKRIFLANSNSIEACIIPWIDIIAIKNFKEAILILNQEKTLIIEEKINFLKYKNENKKDLIYDFKYILWQEHAKRALEIAATWWHNIIMNWVPWTWKTMLAKTFATILPDLTIEESIEISKIYSISWLLNAKNPLIFERPFRSIHHTASAISIIWWWRNAKPWEISLAHKWVLFLDEILEFQKSVLEILRQPLEDWNITVNRVNASYNYPAKFILLWAMNPCPCWYLTDKERTCTCSQKQIEMYKSRLSWPLLDRIDMFIEVPKLKLDKFNFSSNCLDIIDSKTIKNRLEKARQIQLKRFEYDKITFNSEMSTKHINKYCKLDTYSEEILKKAILSLKLSTRSYYRVLKLSRTIADLSWENNIKKEHIFEALSYRKNDEV